MKTWPTDVSQHPCVRFRHDRNTFPVELGVHVNRVPLTVTTELGERFAYIALPQPQEPTVVCMRHSEAEKVFEPDRDGLDNMRTQDIGCLSYAEAVKNSLTEALADPPPSCPVSDTSQAPAVDTDAPSTALDPSDAAFERTHSRGVSLSAQELDCLNYAESIIHTQFSPPQEPADVLPLA